MIDYITARERLNPNTHRFSRWFAEVWLRWKYKIACWELEKQQKHAAEWLWVKMVCADKLKELGLNPDQLPEDLTKILEVYLFLGCLVLVLLVGFLFNEYRSALIDLITRNM